MEGIREQAAQWAMQDLRLKREKLAREVKVEDPVAWLNQVVAKVSGENLGLTVTEVFDNPQALVCTAKDGRKVVFLPASPNVIRRINIGSKSKLSRIGNRHPLMSLPKGMNYMELSMLNAGVLFDLELPMAWKMLTGIELQRADSLSLYSLPV